MSISASATGQSFEPATMLDSNRNGSGMICSICQEAIGAVRPDAAIETIHSLPCGHRFGNICILRWLQDSLHQDCPHCRRTMVHPGCGHLIMPHDAATAPPPISQKETPEQCVRCRGEGVVAQALRFEHERLVMQERALRGMQMNLPNVFGLAMVKNADQRSVEDRIADLKRAFAAFHERAWREFAEKERRQKW